MSDFDPIATRTVRKAENLEPAFVHADQVDASLKKLAEHRARRRKPPNFLIFMMDDVGLGRFRLLRRWRSGRRSNAQFRQACAQRPAAYILLLGAKLFAFASHDADRTCAASPRSAASADVWRGGRPGRRDHHCATAFGCGLCDAGGWQMAFG